MKEIVVDGPESVADLTELRGVPRADVLGAGFHDLGLLLTIDQRLPFAEVRSLAASSGIREVLEAPPHEA